jgi:hypothetical protein
VTESREGDSHLLRPFQSQRVLIVADDADARRLSVAAGG